MLYLAAMLDAAKGLLTSRTGKESALSHPLLTAPAASLPPRLARLSGTADSSGIAAYLAAADDAGKAWLGLAGGARPAASASITGRGRLLLPMAMPLLAPAPLAATKFFLLADSFSCAAEPTTF